MATGTNRPGKKEHQLTSLGGVYRSPEGQVLGGWCMDVGHREERGGHAQGHVQNQASWADVISRSLAQRLRTVRFPQGWRWRTSLC